MKTVSVIVPVYNVENYLRQCLDSLVNQTLEDIEIIVVNDSSPDNSQKIIDEYQERYPTCMKSFIKENGGQGSARNFGLQYANGKYISFVDSDDWLDLDALKNMYELAEAKNSDIVICDMLDHYADGTTVHHNCTKFDSVYTVTPSASNKIFKRSAIDQLRFVEKIWYEDFNFTTKLLFQNPNISVISEPYYHCNCRAVSTMNNNNSKKNLDIITAMDDIIDYAKRNDCYDENIIQFLVFHHILMATINRVAAQNSSDKKMVLAKLVAYCKANLKDYTKHEFYKSIEGKRKLIGFLNYHGLYDLSKLIFAMKAKV